MEPSADRIYHSLCEAIANSDADYVLMSTGVLIDKRTFLHDLEGNDVVGEFHMRPGIYTRSEMSGRRSAQYVRIESSSFADQSGGRTHPIGLLTGSAAQALDFV